MRITRKRVYKRKGDALLSEREESSWKVTSSFLESEIDRVTCCYRRDFDVRLVEKYRPFNIFLYLPFIFIVSRNTDWEIRVSLWSKNESELAVVGGRWTSGRQVTGNAGVHEVDPPYLKLRLTQTVRNRVLKSVSYCSKRSFRLSSTISTEFYVRII